MVYGEDEGLNSKFNAGMLQMSRLHKLQEHMNLANYNPLAYDEMLGVYNYQTIITDSTNIIEEAGIKLSKTEKKEALELKKEIERLLKKFPIHEIKKHPTTPNKTITKFNRHFWEWHKKLVFKYEDMARGLLDKHNLNSPPEDESALF